MFTENYYFYGLHAQQATALYQNISNVDGVNRKVFNRLVDVLVCAPLVGFLYQRKADLDQTTEGRANVMAEQVIREQKRLETDYCLITLLDKEEEPDINKRLDRAFRGVDEDVKKGRELFDAYARGGVEVLYENIIGTTNDESEIIGNLYDFVNDFEERFNASIRDTISS